MKYLAPTAAVLLVLISLISSGCSSYDAAEGSNFSQRDLELQRRIQERQVSR